MTGSAPLALILALALSAPAAAQPELDLLNAVTQADVPKVKRLLDAGADADGRTSIGQSLLEAAIGYSRRDESGASKVREIARLLVEKGADVNAKSKFGAPLFNAVYVADPALVRFLLEKGAKPDLKSPFDGSTPLENAVLTGKAEIIRVLVEKGARLKSTPLTEAILREDIAGVKAALEAGAKPNSGEPRPLLLATAMGNAELVRMLLDGGAKTGAAGAQGTTALHVACGAGRLELARLLIERGAPVDAQTEGGTPLMWAASYRNEELVRLLLDKGADVHQKTKHGGTALVSAVIHSGTSTVKALLERGADPNDKIGASTSLLTVAGSPGTIKLLLDSGAEPPEDFGVHLVHTATSKGDPEYVSIILDRELRVIDYQLRAALKAAEDKGQTEVARLLRKVEKAGLVTSTEDAATLARRKAAEAEEARRQKALDAETAGDASAKAGRNAEALKRYAQALESSPKDAESENRLREKAIRAGAAAKPPIPEEARAHMVRAMTVIKKAQNADDYKLAVEELEGALRLAPWWDKAYFNLGLVSEKVQDYEGAIRNLRLYLAASPRGPEAGKVQDKIYALEAERKMAQRALR